jgi:hypothetical protein
MYMIYLHMWLYEEKDVYSVLRILNPMSYICRAREMLHAYKHAYVSKKEASK